MRGLSYRIGSLAVRCSWDQNVSFIRKKIFDKNSFFRHTIGAKGGLSRQLATLKEFYCIKIILQPQIDVPVKILSQKMKMKCCIIFRYNRFKTPWPSLKILTWPDASRGIGLLVLGDFGWLEGKTRPLISARNQGLAEVKCEGKPQLN